MPSRQRTMPLPSDLIATQGDEAASAPGTSNSFTVIRNEKSRIMRSQHTVGNLLAFTAGQRIGDREVFKADVEKVRHRLHTINRRTIDPRSGFMRVWDLLTVVALLFTCFVTPFEIAFFEAKLYAGPVNFSLNRAVDMIFLGDICLSFFLPYRASAKAGGMMVYDNRKICAAYLRGWFALDAITCIPFDLVAGGVAAAAGVTVDATFFRLLRMLRVLKLMRILRASRIINRWQDHIAMSFAFMSLLRFTFLTFMLAHWLACLWGFVAVRPEPSATNVTWTSYGDGLSWVQKANIPSDVSPYELYGISLYVALNNIFGGVRTEPRLLPLAHSEACCPPRLVTRPRATRP